VLQDDKRNISGALSLRVRLVSASFNKRRTISTEQMAIEETATVLPLCRTYVT